MAFLIVGRSAWRCEVHTVHSMHSIWKSRWCSESSSVIFSIYKYMYNCKYSCHHHVLWLSCWSFSLSSIIAPSMFSQSVDTPQTSLFGLLHILLSEENLHRDSALSATSRWLYWNPTLMAPNDGPPNTRSLQLCTSCTTILSYSRKIVYTYFGQLSYLDCTMKIKNPLNIFIFLNQCLPDIITIYPCTARRGSPTNFVPGMLPPMERRTPWCPKSHSTNLSQWNADDSAEKSSQQIISKHVKPIVNASHTIG